MTSYREILEGRGRRLRRWTATSLAVLAVHFAGGALAVYNWPEEDYTTDDAGAFAVELAPVQAAPKLEQLEAAIGPQSTESAPSVTPTEEILETSDIESVDLDPAPLAPEPEVVLPDPEPVEEIDEIEAEEQPQPEVLAEAQSSFASPLTAAPPPVEAPVAKKAVAPRAGASKKPSEAQVSWHKSIVRRINEKKRYPRQARRKKTQGITEVSFTLDRSGTVLGSRVIKSSGSTDLDEEALAVLERSSPFPPPPDDVAAVTINMRLPIKFQIAKR
jgi:periplasmic protein TonB